MYEDAVNNSARFSADDCTGLRVALDDLRFVFAQSQRIAQTGVFTYNPATGEMRWSEEECRIHGLPSDSQPPSYDVLLNEFVHPDDRELLDRTFREAVREDGVFELEHRIVRPDRTVRFVNNRAHPHLDQDGRLLRYVGVTQDITDLRRLDEENQLERMRLQTLMETLPVGVFVTDAVGHTVYSNKYADDIWGGVVPVESSDDYGLYKGWHPDTGERLKASDWAGARALSGETVVGEVVHIERFTGEKATIVDSAAPTRGADGEITGAVIIEQDITEQVRAEQQLKEAHEALKRSEERWNLAIEHFSEGAIIATEDEQVIYWNPAARKMHGFTSPDEGIEPLEQTPVTFDLLTPQDRRLLTLEEWPMKRIKRGEPVHNLELRLRRPDQGWEKIVSYSGAMVDTASGERLIFLSVHDLTEQRRVEARLREALEVQREARRYSEALNEVDAEVTATLDAQRIMKLVLEKTAKTVGADVGAVYVPVGGAWEARYTWQAPEWLEGTVVRASQIPFSMHAAQERRAVLFDDPSRYRGWDESIVRTLGARQVLDAPLVLGAEEIGDLSLCKLDGGRFTDADRDFLQKVSVTATLALRNARSYESERTIADTLQEALIVLPDEVRGIEFSHVYHSASEAARVGGDFYDLFEIADDHVGLVVGDVAGKGLQAAVLTSMVKNTIRAHAHERGKSPARILELTNDVVYSATPSEAFVTVFFAVLDCRTGTMVYSNAGHTTAAIARLDSTASTLPSTGPILGAFPGTKFDQAETRLEIGEILFLYTDGLTEARREDELYDEERVFVLLASGRSKSTRDVVATVVTDVLEFSHNQLRDDLAILAVKRIKRGSDAPQKQRLELFRS